MKSQSKQVYLKRLSSSVIVTDLDKFVVDIFSCNKASEIELFLVECLRGAKLEIMDFDELKLRACELSLCFFSAARVRAEKSHSLQGNEDPPLYLIFDLFTCFFGELVCCSCLYLGC